MRLIVLLSLLATVSPPSCCERRNTTVCANEAGFECDEGQLCQVPSGQTFGACVQAECGVGQVTCPGERPLCVAGRCKACEVDADCLVQSSATPVCIEGSCVACRDNSQCKSSDRKVCDATSHTCRGCKLHSECSPGVCAKDDAFATLSPPILPGTCVDASQVVEVDGPCGTNCLSMALSNSVSTAKPYLRIGKHSTTSRVTIPVLPPGLPRFYIIGPLADVRATQIATAPQMNLSNASGPALEVLGGSHVTLEGVIIKDSVTGLDCNSKSSLSTGTPTKVSLIRSLVGGNQVAIKASTQCELDLDQTWIGKGPTAVFASISRNDTSMILDSTRLRMVNSVLWDNGKSSPQFGGIKLTDTATRRPAVHIVNSTFARLDWADMGQMTLAVDCDYDPAGSLAIVNTLFLNENLSMGYTYIRGLCHMTTGSLTAVGSDDPSLTGTGNLSNLASAATFVDAANGDLHVRTTAQTGVTNGGVSNVTDGKGGEVLIPSVDFEGKSRGPAGSPTVRSLGAFEVSR